MALAPRPRVQLLRQAVAMKESYSASPRASDPPWNALMPMLTGVGRCSATRLDACAAPCYCPSSHVRCATIGM
eukprot:5814622-Pyramimonas_sp.AAC.3